MQSLSFVGRYTILTFDFFFCPCINSIKKISLLEIQRTDHMRQVIIIKLDFSDYTYINITISHINASVVIPKENWHLKVTSGSEF